MLEVTVANVTYPLATNLRVAYAVQGQHNHKSYMDIFQNVDDLPLEDQIGIVYAAANVGSIATTDFPTRQQFLNDFLDDPTMSVKGLMSLLKEIFAGITGVDLSQISEEAESTENPEGEK